MHVLKERDSTRYIRPGGITSYLLASPRTSSAEHLTTTLAVIQPGGEQRIHSHRPEQVYFILEGSGLMTVGDETQRVGPGDCVFIPSGQPHGLKNDGDGTLRYFSAAAPAYEPGHLEKILAAPKRGRESGIGPPMRVQGDLSSGRLLSPGPSCFTRSFTIRSIRS